MTGVVMIQSQGNSLAWGAICPQYPMFLFQDKCMVAKQTVGHELQELESRIGGLDPKYLAGGVTCKPSELFLRNSY